MITSIDVSQEIAAMDILKALKSSLKHHPKPVLRLLQLYGDQALDAIPIFAGLYIFVAFDAGDKPVGLFADLLLTKTIEGREVNLGLFLGVPELEFNCVSKFKFSGRLSNCTCKYRTTDRAHC